MFKIDNEKEFISFLKLLAEESVNQSKKVLKENDQYADSFSERLKKEKELYEQEEEEEAPAEEEPAEADPELGAGENQEQEKVEPEKEPEAEIEPSQNREELRASLDALERNINALRAGRSLKDSTVESQLEIYFDRLGEDEKSLMVLFIRELSKILSGEITGDSAVDPADDPYNLDVIKAGEEKEAEKKPPTEDEAPPSAEIEEEPDEEEDTSPPIKVGEPQNLAEIRKRIRKLMSM